MNDKFIAIRLDDFHHKCKIENWDYLINKLIERGIPCHVGLIACNKDSSIFYRDKPIDIWSKARYWQKRGICFWIHGHSHILREGACNFSLSRVGEFYEDEYSEINNKLNEVLKLFDANGIIPKGYFAPAHGYSPDLVATLKENPRINIVWDGFWPSPKCILGLKFLPQQFWSIYPRFLRPIFSGVCLHPSNMSKKDIDLFMADLSRIQYKDLNVDFNKLKYSKINFNDKLFNLFYRILYFLKNFKYMKKFITFTLNIIRLK